HLPNISFPHGMESKMQQIQAKIMYSHMMKINSQNNETYIYIFRYKSFTQTSIKHFERNNEIQTGKAFRISMNNRPSGPSGWPEPKSQSFYPDHGTVVTSPALCSVCESVCWARNG